MKDFDADREEVIRRARDNGFEALIPVGSDLEATFRAVQLAGSQDMVYAAVGIHPHDAKDYTEEAHSRLRQWAGHPKVVALGETGLDYHYDHSPRETQCTVFRRHLDLARDPGG